MTSRAVVGIVAIAAALGCAPRLPPLVGTPVPSARLPRGSIAGDRQLVFSWELHDQDIVARGDGVARIAPPDSARLDFFLAGGFGSGAAILVGDSLDAPGADLVRRLIPPPALMWAALGRVALPNLADTVIRVDGTLLRADFGQPVAWRLTFRGDTLVRGERVQGGRVVEWVERADATHTRYQAGRRTLQLTVTRAMEVPGFDASIWHLDR